jgi:hypothetical protein
MAVPDTDATERLGVFAVGLRAERAGWAFRELPRPDRGVDAHIEARTDGRPDGRLLALQIKSGESQFRQRVPGGWRFYIDSAHSAYWRKYSMPVLLVLYKPRTDAAFWQVVNPDTTQSTGDGCAVDVPESNVFDACCSRDLDAVAATSNETADGLRDRRTDVDLPWIWMLDGGDRLFVEVEQNLLPADGPCVLRMIAQGADGDTSVVRTWPWAFLATLDFRNELLHLFPWADKQVDEPWYRERTVGNFASEHGQWSIEDQSYEFDADFDDWFKERFGSTTIVPYATTSDGRTALWRLELTLNTEGHEALERDKQEMLREVDYAEIGRDRDYSRSEGYYTIEFIEHYIDMLDNLVFIYGDDDEEEDKESLLIEPHLVDDSGGLVHQAVEAILRHMGITSPTQGWSKAFNRRFSEDLEVGDGPIKLNAEDINEWLAELRRIAESRGPSPLR